MKNFMILLIIVSIFSSCSDNSINENEKVIDTYIKPSPPPPLVGPMLFYKMNGNGNDSSGNNLHAITVNATLTADRYGNPNSAYSFNGVNQFIDFPNIRPNLPVTISYWFKTMTSDPFKNSFFCTNIHSNNIYSGFWGNISPSMRLENSFGNGLYGADSSNRRTISSNSTILINQWYFAIVIIRSKDDMTLYLSRFGDLDGDPVTCCFNDNGTLNGSAINLYSDFNLGSIGRANAQNINYFQGSMDQFRIWNRVLTQKEIFDLCKIERGVCNDNPR